MKYRKKPIVIDAIQWTGENREEVERFTGLDLNMGRVRNHITIQTLEGLMFAAPGDWIIKDEAGAFSPCKPSIFEATYEAV